MLPIARPPNPNASVRQVSPAKTTKPDANAGSAHPVPLEPARRRLNGTKVKKSQCRWHVTGYAAGGQTKKMAFFRQTLVSDVFIKTPRSRVHALLRGLTFGS